MFVDGGAWIFDSGFRSLCGKGPRIGTISTVFSTLPDPIHPYRTHGMMHTEKIPVRMENGRTMEVVVLSKRAGCIQVVIGEGTHSVRCELLPTRGGRAYSGTVMGREIVHERSTAEVQADLDRLNPDLRKSRLPRRR